MTSDIQDDEFDVFDFENEVRRVNRERHMHAREGSEDDNIDDDDDDDAQYFDQDQSIIDDIDQHNNNNAQIDMMHDDNNDDGEAVEALVNMHAYGEQKSGWQQHHDIRPPPPISLQPTPTHRFNHNDTTLDIFNLIWSTHLFDTIAQQTNLYAQQQQAIKVYTL
jgi:hypothetical protein